MFRPLMPAIVPFDLGQVFIMPITRVADAATCRVAEECIVAACLNGARAPSINATTPGAGSDIDSSPERTVESTRTTRVTGLGMLTPMREPPGDWAAEALSKAGLLGGGRVLATEPMAGGQTSSVHKVLLSTGQAVVLKIAHARVIETEALWLRGWRHVGVDTPEVYAHGVLTDSTPYLLMEFVDGPSVRSEVEAGRLPYEDTLRRTGRMLAIMHAVRGSGFGSANQDYLHSSGAGRFQSLREQLASEALPRGLAFALEMGGISENDLRLVELAIDVLNEHASVTGPRRTHGDFRTGNIIHSGDRFVVIDPSPALTHPYLCLAYSLLLPELATGFFPVDVLSGYEEASPVNTRALDAALLIRAGIMFDSFGRRRGSDYARRLPALFARLRARFN
jgi:fructosamine-3-kinase